MKGMIVGSMSTLQEQFGHIDIYVFDHILRGHIAPGMRVVDAGCGSGRNLVYLLREGYEVFAADSDGAAVDHVRRMAASLAPALPASNFRVETVEAMSFPDAFADVVISNTVLHLAGDDAQFQAMLHGTWRVLRPGGFFFSRLASSIGMESRIQWIEGRRALLPDGSTRYVVDEPFLLKLTQELGGKLIDPLKTTVVQNQRCMTTWVVRKNS
jgi:tellurite methyltransferase